MDSASFMDQLVQLLPTDVKPRLCLSARTGLFLAIPLSAAGLFTPINTAHTQWHNFRSLDVAQNKFLCFHIVLKTFCCLPSRFSYSTYSLETAY